MINNNLLNKIHTAIKEVWVNDLSVDYENNFLLKEDSLKNAFYFHLRNRLGDCFLNEHNLRIFTEFKVANNRIDLAIVEIDPQMTLEKPLSECVTKIVASIEMKYKSAGTQDFVFYQDIEKIFSYIDTWGNDTKHYFAFIQEEYFNAGEIINWIEAQDVASMHGKITELYAYWNESNGEAVWKVVDY